MNMTGYFRATRSRPDRVIIRDEWIRYVIESPEGGKKVTDLFFRMSRCCV